MNMAVGIIEEHLREEYHNLIVEIIDSIPNDRITVDILSVIAILKELKILKNEKCEELKHLCQQTQSNKERLKIFACNIYEKGSLDFLFKILDLIGQGPIANAISQRVIRPIHRAKLKHSKHLQLFYHQLKNNIDWNNFHDPGEVLKEKYYTIIRSFNDFRMADDILKAAGRLAVVTWLRVQHCRRNTQLIRLVLNGMIENWPRGIDNTLARIFFNSKMAIAAIMDGDVPSAEEHSRIAKHISASFQDPLTKALICHDSRYTNQRIFEYQRTEIHRKAVFDETVTGLCFIESDSNGCELFNRQMKRMFLLYAAQYKLNIHNDLNSQESEHVSIDEGQNASNLIDSFERTRAIDEPIDPRRGMIYMVCKARVHEYKGQYSKAEIVLSYAMKSAVEGAHYQNEATNIRDFANRLLTRN